MEIAFEVICHLLCPIIFYILWRSYIISLSANLFFLQSIRSKMSMRAEDRPKAFEAQFLTTSGRVAEYGAFDVKPGAVVRTTTIHKQLNNNKMFCTFRD